jgi:radical SAM superfamily enzyme YgiQ (UPF0313 family)
MNILLVSTYELGRQPFGVASAAAWLIRAGHQVHSIDTSRQTFSPEMFEDLFSWAGMIAFHLPMHTATRLAAPLIAKAGRVNPTAQLCCFGLYAPLNEKYLRELGVRSIIGGEFEAGLVEVAAGKPVAPISLERLEFITPDRSSLPGLDHYAKLRIHGENKLAGYTEASRGCKHRCRHCPVVNVYDGRFRVVQAEAVLADIRQQIEAGAEHITFGDPDFWNGPAHAARITAALHREYPNITYDATIKVGHLRKHADLLPALKETGCLFVTSAVESIDDDVLARLEKGHTYQDFLWVVREFRSLDLLLSPTFIPFTPWTNREGYSELLDTIEQLDLIDNVSSVQLGLRLLIPAGSRLLELGDIPLAGFDDAALLWRWRHSDPQVDAMASMALKVAAGAGSRRELFAKFSELANGTVRRTPLDLVARAAIPFLDEPWYC